jgi:hypothetical protein
MSKFNINNFKTTIAPRKRARENEVTISYTLKNEKEIEIKQIKDLYDHLAKDIKKKGMEDKTKVLITVVNGMSKYWTVKGFNDKGVYLDEYDDYFSSSVKSTSKFDKVAQINITLIST